MAAVDAAIEAGRQVNAQKAAQHKAEQSQPFWKKGIGEVLGNPVVQGALFPLGLLSIGGKAVTLARSEAAQHLPEGAEQFIDKLVQIGLHQPMQTRAYTETDAQGNRQLRNANMLQNPLGSIDEARARADKSSNWGKLAPRSDYGTGKVQVSLGNDWLDRLQGFSGDVASDPLTYITAGGSRATMLDRAAEAATRVARTEEALNLASKAGRPAEEIAGITEELDQARKAAEFAKDLPPVRGSMPLPHTRAERMSVAAEWVKNLPAEQFKSLEGEIQKGVSRGFLAMSPEARDALGIEKAGLRIRGFNTRIPGTSLIGEGVGEIGSRVRQGLNALPGEESKLRNIRVPKGYEEATNVLGRERPGDVFLAATDVLARESARAGEGGFVSRANRVLTSGIRKAFKGVSTDGRRALLEEAERDAQPNAVNEIFSRILDTYKRATGRTLDPAYLRNPDTYVPHILEPGFRRHLKAVLASGGDEAKVAEAYKKAAGFATVDLLESSGFLESGRRLDVNADGTARTLKLGGREVVIDDATIGGLNNNQTLKDAFPSYKGKFYMDDPATIAEAYVGSLKKQAGRDAAVKALVDSGNPHVATLTGDLEATWKAMNEALAQQGAVPLTSTMRAGYTPGVNVPPVPAAPPVPGGAEDAANRAFHAAAPEAMAAAATPEEAAALASEVAATPQPLTPIDPNEFFKTTKNKAATQEQTNFLLGQGKKYARAARKDVTETVEATREALSGLRDDMTKGIRGSIDDAKEALKPINARIKNYAKIIEDFGPLTADNEAEVSSLLANVDQQILDTERELKTKSAVWKGRSTKAQNELERDLYGQLRELKAVREKAEQKLNEASARIAENVGNRAAELNRPVAEAQARLFKKEARFVAENGPAPFQPSDIEWANDHIAQRKANLEPSAAYQAKADEYRQALAEMDQLRQNLPLKRGVITPEGMAALDAHVAKTEGIGLELSRMNPKPDAYEAARNELNQLQGQLRSTPVAERAPIEKRIAELNKDFAPGGKHFDSARADKIIASTLEYERKMKQFTWWEQSEIDATRGAKAHKVELIGIADRKRVRATRVAEQRFADDLPDKIQTEQARVAGEIGAQADAELGPISAKQGVMKNLSADLTDKERLVAKRDNARVLRERLRKVDPKYRRLDLEASLNEIEDVARQNPLLTNPELTAAESLLQTNREALQRAKRTSFREKDVERLIADAENGKLGPIMMATLNDNWKALHSGPLQTGDVIVSAELSRRLQNLYPIATEPKWLGRTFNSLTNLFKTYATLSPGFHVRNALSGIFMNTADGVLLSKQWEGSSLWREMRQSDDTWLDRQPLRVQQAFEAAAATGAGGRYEEAGIRAQSASKYESWAKIYNRLSNNPMTRFSQRVGSRVEGALRLGMALDTLDRGGTVEDAISRISRIHFDYAQVSQLDETMRRIFPFWTFMSRNLPMQVQEMWTNPRLYAYYGSVQRNFQLPDAPLTPSYWKTTGAWRTPLNNPLNGQPLYFQPDLAFNQVPANLQMLSNAASGDAGALLGNVNPLMSAPADFFNKRDSYYDRNYDSTDYTKKSGILGTPETILASLLGQTNDAGEVSDNFDNFLNSINPVQNRLDRLVPGAFGDKTNSDQQLAAWASFLGLPPMTRSLSPSQQRTEFWRRYNEALDKAKATTASAKRQLQGQ